MNRGLIIGLHVMCHLDIPQYMAPVYFVSTMAVLAFPIEEKIKKESLKSIRKRRYKINRTNALAMTREVIGTIFIQKKAQKGIKAFDKIVESTTECVRPNRQFPRNKIPKRPPSMNYKQL